MVIFTIRYFGSIFLFAQSSGYDCWDKVHIILVRWQRSLLVHDTFHSLLQAMGYGVLNSVGWNPYLAETSSDIASLVHNREGCCLSGRFSSHHRCSATLYILGSSWCGCECNLRSLGVGADALFPGLGRRGWVPQCKSYLRGEECWRDGVLSNWACGLESLVQLRHSCRCMLEILGQLILLMWKPDWVGAGAQHYIRWISAVHLFQFHTMKQGGRQVKARTRSNPTISFRTEPFNSGFIYPITGLLSLWQEWVMESATRPAFSFAVWSNNSSLNPQAI